MGLSFRRLVWLMALTLFYSWSSVECGSDRGSMTYGRFCSFKKTTVSAGYALRTLCMHSIICSVYGMRSWYHCMPQECSPQRKGVLEFHVNGTDTSHTCWLLSQLKAKSLGLSSYFQGNCSSKKKLPPAQESYESTRPYLSDSTTVDCASGSVVFEMLGSKVFAISHDPLRDFPEVAACGWTITRVVSAYYAGGLSVR